MKKIIIMMCMISVLLNAGIDGKKKIDLQYLDNLKLSDILTHMANETSKQFPMQIDKITTGVRVFSYSNTLVYVKEIDFSSVPSLKESFTNKEIKSSFKKELYEQDKNVVCNQEFISYLLKNKNAIVEYKWQDEKSIPIFEYTVEYEDCLK